MAAEDDNGTPRRVTRPSVQITFGERSGTAHQSPAAMQGHVHAGHEGKAEISLEIDGRFDVLTPRVASSEAPRPSIGIDVKPR
jgi:hypothetical protein